ncbi:putative phosphatidylinositol 3,4,5-trisphosphate 3-phosphatase TPTE2P1 [Macaca fascicularis]|uniref:putative phosphatidylinositol 3,4,5-trisphosphate 3-phosphatase TPTE2P1 n=1 Tax=Macaca fascicularis TaxID=9541 RepID=UPI0032B0320D
MNISWASTLHNGWQPNGSCSALLSYASGMDWIPWIPHLAPAVEPARLKPTSISLSGEWIWLCHTGWSAVVQSRLTATTTFQAQAILPPQPPDYRK